MKHTIVFATIFAMAGTAASAMSLDNRTTACGFGSGLGPDVVCSEFVQAEFYSKATEAAGYSPVNFATAPVIRISDMIGDTYLTDAGEIVIGVDGTQSDLFTMYLRWMALNGLILADHRDHDLGQKYAYAPLGFDFDGSVLDGQ